MISIRDVTFQYQNEDSGAGGIRGINLEIRSGECVLLCGRSGCGKSTLLKLLNGLIPKYYPGELDGEIWVDGKRIDTYPMYELSKKVGSVFQNPRTQFFNVDVNSEIVFGMENYARSYDHMEARRRKVLQDFELEELSDKSIFNLSGGEKQRVAFGSVYAMDPDIYLLDEPSSNLDAHTIDRLAGYIRTIKEHQKTVLIAEHRLYYLIDVVDRVLYMEDGQIVQDLTREEFLGLSDAQMEVLGLRTRDILPVRQAVRSRSLDDIRGRTEFETEQISVLRNHISILKDLNLQAEKGDIIAMIGRNGIGKTTLIRYLCGLHKQGSGKILLEGREQTGRDRRRMAYLVMQDVNYQLFAGTVLEECCFGLKHYDRERVEQMLQRFGLWDVRLRHPNTLSGGQKQRLAVITGCISDRDVLILDEPTSGLDYDSMREMAQLLREIAGDKIILVVTHDDEFIASVCTGIVDLSGFTGKERGNS